jgi:hypothetical protein
MQPTLNPTYTLFQSSLVVAMILGIVAQAHLMGQSAGTFIPTGNMTTARANHTATLLLDGRVLIAGGLNYPSLPFPSVSPSALATAEVYDPATGTCTATGSMTTARSGHTATLLPDGRVLIAGGSTSSAELYNPSTQTFSATGEMLSAHQRGSATLLPNGKVLITGGIAGSSIASPELYDPSTGMFSLAGPYASIYQNDDGFSSTATLLPNGRVLFTADALYAQYGGELYDSTTNTFSLTGAMVSNIVGRTAALLIDGKVLLAGGFDGGGRYQKAEQYDPVTGKFTATGDMTTPRNAHAAVLLPDGTALITGGEGWGPGADGRCCQFLGSLASAEIYDSFEGAFTRTGNMTAPREYQQSTLLNDGRVLVTGGLSFAGIGLFNGSISSSELYNPPVLTPAPALFSLSGNGKGQGAIWHGDTGQLASASSPAVAGEVLSMYTTSLVHGGVIPPQVAVGGSLGTVLYFGDAPGYRGYYQVNFVVPAGSPPGPAVPVRLTYIGRSSNSVTVGVK